MSEGPFAPWFHEVETDDVAQQIAWSELQRQRCRESLKAAWERHQANPFRPASTPMFTLHFPLDEEEEEEDEITLLRKENQRLRETIESDRKHREEVARRFDALADAFFCRGSATK
jgi:hypothetical protein